jgi:DNA processing protein
MDLLRQWPRNYIAAELLQHPEPEQYLLSGGLHRALPKGWARRGITAAASPTIEQSGGRTGSTPCSRSAVLSILDEGYPALLRQIPDPPLLFYYRGNTELLGEPAVAVVGARRCTSQGRDNARVLARQLAEYGVHVVSGLALGIDGAAHAGALAAAPGAGRTIAILGGGLQRLYPRRHLELAQNIVAHGGLILSEYPDAMPPLAHQFPERNRLISGLSVATVVVEATLKSGSLITARFAAEQGRDVFAMPGPVNSLMSQGCHQLIQQGAGLVANAADVLLGLGTETPAAAPAEAVSGDAGRVLALIGGYPVSMDELMIDTGLEPGHLTRLLVDLELAGIVQQGPLGYSRTSGNS